MKYIHPVNLSSKGPYYQSPKKTQSSPNKSNLVQRDCGDTKKCKSTTHHMSIYCVAEMRKEESSESKSFVSGCVGEAGGH